MSGKSAINLVDFCFFSVWLIFKIYLTILSVPRLYSVEVNLNNVLFKSVDRYLLYLSNYLRDVHRNFHYTNITIFVFQRPLKCQFSWGYIQIFTVWLFRYVLMNILLRKLHYSYIITNLCKFNSVYQGWFLLEYYAV